ncbi:uncharacterized protein LOC127251330 [Andrographis paniculata]|uniref:uncharacterized protein LOC127251330 n=1 Tax=Andrographis paniculata TaxID=175694 RepID=UPI0021E7E223|nr:uncharacterized protein LOC127251330 [Andrographis paniculata]
MAQDLDDGEFWLPSEFLTDDDLLTDFKADRLQSKGNPDFTHGFGNSFGFNSDLSSPGESVMGSTETESDEDDFITGLNWKMARSSLQDTGFTSDNMSKGWKLSGSPQSTLCGCKAGSSRGSPNSVSRVSSPPDGKDVGWDLLYAAAGEVARMRMIEETTAFHSAKQHFPPPKPNPNPVSIQVEKSHTASGGIYRSQTQNQSYHAYLQLQASQRLKQQQMLRSGVWGQGRMDYQFGNGGPVGAGRTQGPSMAAWPTLQQSHQQQQQHQTGSGMRAVFLGGAATRKERTGTGVFLPRRVGTNPPETRKKTGCSTVLLPERVVQALNLNLESNYPQTNVRSHGNFTPEYDPGLNRRSNVLMAEQRNLLQQPLMHPELRLPQEWTY